jgi:hypothetical protein
MADAPDILRSDYLLRDSDLRDFVVFLLKGTLRKQERDLMGVAEAEYVRQATKALQPLMGESVNPTAIAELRAKGYTVPPHVFSTDELSAINAHLAGRKLSWHVAETRGIATLENIPAGAVSGVYDPQTVLSCPAFVKCIQNPAFIRLMSEYLGAPATISTVTAWWSFPLPGADLAKTAGHQLYHHDRGDFRSCNLFVYLTDVDETNGPHRYVIGSHDITLLGSWAQRFDAKTQDKFFDWIERHRKQDEEVASAFTPERIVTFTGPAGTSFFEDTRGLHKGSPLRAGRRLAFEICYSVFPKFTEQFEPRARRDLGVSEEGLDDLTRYATRLIYK